MQNIGYLEPGWAPVDKLHSLSCLNNTDGGIAVFGHAVSPIQKTTCHVLAHTWVTLDKLVAAVETGVRQFLDRALLVECTFR